MNVYTQMHLYFCSTVLLSATPGSERLLPYNAFQTIAQLFISNPIHLLSISIDYPMTFSG